jgi:hypothetical protein
LRTVAVDEAGKLDALRQMLAAPEAQVRLNAAVRLAYLRCADGLEQLVEGLSHPEPAIALVQVPEALALLGEPGLVAARQVMDGPGRSRLAAARVLVHAGELTGVPDAIAAALDDPDATTRSEAVSMAGELGPRVASVFGPLVRAVEADGDTLRHGVLGIGLPALASVDGERALPLVVGHLDNASPVMRISAMHALSGIGLAAVTAYDQLSDAVGDHGISLRERLAAGHALTRVGPTGDAVTAALLGALAGSDRWLRIGLLRLLSQVAPGYPRRLETSRVWPLWESKLIHSIPPQRVEESKDLLAGSLAEHLDDDDYDVRRNAALAIALLGPTGRSVTTQVQNASRLPEPLRDEVLRRLSPRGQTRPATRPGRSAGLDPVGWPWDLWATGPDVDLGAISKDCEQQWATGDKDVGYRIAVPKWAFLQYLVQRHGVILHGSKQPGLELLRPMSRSWGGGRAAGQPGVFGVDHALMAIYFAILNRWSEGGFYNPNAIWSAKRPDGQVVRCFRLGAEFTALSARPFVEGTVYILPPDSFHKLGELTSLKPVRPLARLSVSPRDFPLLEHLWGADIGALSAQFGTSFPFLRDVGEWPSKRSSFSATF